MSRLAHATLAAPGFEAEKRDMTATAQLEISQAKRIQQQSGCSWTEALLIAHAKLTPPTFIIDNADIATVVAIAIRTEREACAKVCDQNSHRNDDMGAIIGRAIRARGTP